MKACEAMLFGAAWFATAGALYFWMRCEQFRQAHKRAIDSMRNRRRVEH